jgi:Cu/Ag efflux protein CusF
VTKPRALLATAVLAVLGPIPSAYAAREFSRGNITAVDWRVMQIEIKTPKGGLLTYKVAPNCAVKFTDGTADFPNPKLEDLTPPMYIHFVFENQTMLEIDVKEVGSAPRPRAQGGGNRGSSDRNSSDRNSSDRNSSDRNSSDRNSSDRNSSDRNSSDRNSSDRNSSDRNSSDRNSSDRNSSDRYSSDRQIKVRILRLDERRGTFEADVAGRRQTFRAENGRLLRGFGEGDLVILGVDRRGGAEVVTDIRTAGQIGRVTRVDERRGEVSIEVRGREALYRVDDGSRLLRRVRVGDRVTFEVEERRGQKVITSIE